MFLMNLMEMIGTFAFAVSGALVGLRHKLDLFGVFVLSVITASGGGLIHDIIIKEGMPAFFSNPKYIIVISLAAALSFVISRILSKVFSIIQIIDAVGLATFTILTAHQCILNQMSYIGVVFISVLTGVGGGVIRDMLVNEIPVIFRSEIYAIASLIGASCFYALYNAVRSDLLYYICIGLIIIIRLISIYLGLNLPVVSSAEIRTKKRFREDANDNKKAGQKHPNAC